MGSIHRGKDHTPFCPFLLPTGLNINDIICVQAAILYQEVETRYWEWQNNKIDWSLVMLEKPCDPWETSFKPCLCNREISLCFPWATSIYSFFTCFILPDTTKNDSRHSHAWNHSWWAKNRIILERQQEGGFWLNKETKAQDCMGEHGRVFL